MNTKYIFLSIMLLATVHSSSAMKKKEKTTKYSLTRRVSYPIKNQDKKDNPRYQGKQNSFIKKCPKAKMFTPAFIMAGISSIILLGLGI